jgi:hypothetical protein
MTDSRLIPAFRDRLAYFVATLLLTAGMSARSIAATSHSEALFDIYPAAKVYFQETDGGVAITFVHNLNLAHAQLCAVAETLNGNSCGNWDSRSSSAQPGASMLLRSDNEGASATRTTITFHDLHLSDVKLFHVLVLSSDPVDSHCALLVNPNIVSASSQRPPSRVSIRINGTTAFLSNGLILDSESGLDSMSRDGRILDVVARGARLTTADGSGLLSASRIEFDARAVAATQPN